MVDEIHHRHKPLVDVKIAQIILILFLTGLALRHGLHIGFDVFRRHKRRTMLIVLRIFSHRAQKQTEYRHGAVVAPYKCLKISYNPFLVLHFLTCIRLTQR